MDDLNKIVGEILEKGLLMSLATQDSGGLWASTVNISFDDAFNIYWISSPDVRHSKAIAENSKVAGTITISSGSKEPNLGLQFAGSALKISDVEGNVVKKYFERRGKQMPGSAEDFLKGRSWYKLKPDFFDIINESLWGYKKQKLEINS